MEQQNFQRLMTCLAAAYSTEVSKDRAAVYWHQLGALPDKPFELAVHQHVGNSSRFPTVVELRHATRAQMLRYEPIPAVRLTQNVQTRKRLIAIYESYDAN